MTDQKNPGDKTLTLTKSTLSLKKPVGSETGVVRQSFSHGRSKPVVVEKVKTRTFAAPTGKPAGTQAAPQSDMRNPPQPTPQPPRQPTSQQGSTQRLSNDEQAARNQALAEARAREQEERRKQDEENRRRAEEEARKHAARSEAEKREFEAAEAARKADEERRRVEFEARRRPDDKPQRLDNLGPAKVQAPAPEPEAPAPVAETPAPRFERPQGDRPSYGDRGPRPQGDRPQGDRPQYGDRGPRPQGDRPPYGDRGPRPQGDRPQGDRPPYGDRGPRPQGDRPPYGDRGPRPDRPAGDRPSYGDRPQGDRPPSRDGRPPRLDGPRPPRTGSPTSFRAGMNVPPVVPEVTAPTRAGPPAAMRGPSPRDRDDDEAPRAGRKGAPGKGVAVVKTPRAGDDRSRSRLTVTNALASDEERQRSEASFRRRVQRMTGHRPSETKEKIMREVVIPETITIQELANRMSERAVDVIRLLMKQGMMLKINDVIDADTAQLITEELGHTVRRVSESDVEEGLFDMPDDDAAMEFRAPVVTIMGHVDHGKTSLLDAIRKTNVVSGEAGGITQHIGAYQVKTPLGGMVTFIDTPGHAAFTAMRARGAKVTDIVVLVVAADDGVMPQTIEAISHAKAAKVPLIVAINKIDKPEANPDRVRTELLRYEVQVESLGGDVIEVEVSAKERRNLDKLLEMIQLQSEVLELKANPDRAAEGSVIEAKLDRGRGPVATVLVQRGTLKQGDIVVAGSEWGRVRALINDRGQQITQAGPSMPVEILGFNGTPDAGDRVAVVETEARAREITDYRAHQRREKAAARLSSGRGTLADMMTNLKASAGKREFTLLIKGDVQGSVEAIIGALDKLGTDEVTARVIHSGVGGISESDVTLAQTSGAIVIGFNTRAHKEARELAEQLGIEIRYYNIIYDLVDDVKAAMSGLLTPELREKMLGNALIQEVFNITKVGKVAGCRVTDGTVERGANVRLIRDSVVIHEGKLSTLKRFKDEVKEVGAGQDCGMAFENYQDIRAGDIIECYRVEEIRRSL